MTDVFDNIGDMLNQLAKLQGIVSEKLEAEGELLWRFSNPPAFSSPEEIPIADFKGSVYRDYLASKYGKVKMLLSGVHLNYSLPVNVISELAAGSGKDIKDIKEYRNKLYLELAAKLLSYSWLIVYLTAASPVLDESFLRFSGISEKDIEKYSSVRCSEIGYWNFFTPTFDFSSLNAYADSIEKYIHNGDFISCSEIYYPIRVKPRGKYDLDLLRSTGINHVELRMIDLNPLSENGIFEKDIEFIHLLILFLLSTERPLPDASQQLTAVNNMKSASLADDTSLINIYGYELPLKTAAALELNRLADFSSLYFPEYLGAVKYQLSKAEKGSYSQLVRRLFADDYMHMGLKLSGKYQRSDHNVYAFCGEFGK